MATIRKRDNGTFEAIVTKAAVPGFKTPRQSGFKTKSEAKAWAAKIEEDFRNDAYTPNRAAQKTTFKFVADRFETEYAPTHYRSQKNDKGAWYYQLQHLKDGFGRLFLSKITPEIIFQYSTDRQKLVSPSTVKKEINLLSKVLTIAAREYGCPFLNGNPVQNVSKPSEGKGRSRRLVGDEGERLLKACDESRSPWLAASVRLALETAMRQGEILGLAWKHVNFERSTAFVELTKNGEDRSVPLSPGALAVLKDLFEKRDDRVFPVQRSALSNAWVKSYERAKLDKEKWHKKTWDEKKKVWKFKFPLYDLRKGQLTDEETKLVLKECKASYNPPVLLAGLGLILESGLTHDDLLSLHWSNIDLKKGTVTCRKRLNGPLISATISPQVISRLRELREQKDDEVFPTHRGAIAHAWQVACKNAEIEDLNFHDLRHEALSRLAERGDFTVLDLSAVSGHKTLQMLKRYTHLQAEKLAEKLATKPGA